MDKDLVKYKISKTRELIRDLEERANNSFSSKYYFQDGKRIRKLAEYKNYLINELKDYEHSPTTFTPKSFFPETYENSILNKIKDGSIKYNSSYNWLTDEQKKKLKKE